MLHAVKILIFILVNATGFYMIPLLVNMAIMAHIYPDLPSGPFLDSFWQWIGFGGICAWGAAALVSLGIFFASGKIRIWLLLAPLYIPAIYGIAVMGYFYLVSPL